MQRIAGQPRAKANALTTVLSPWISVADIYNSLTGGLLIMNFISNSSFSEYQSNPFPSM